MNTKWSTMQIKTPNLKYFPSKSEGFLNKQTTKKGAPLHHNAVLYADDSAFIFLSKADLIAGMVPLLSKKTLLNWV